MVITHTVNDDLKLQKHADTNGGGTRVPRSTCILEYTQPLNHAVSQLYAEYYRVFDLNISPNTSKVISHQSEMIFLAT